MPLMTWELWLARDIVADNQLPWQKSMDKLTPGRVAQAMGGVLAVSSALRSQYLMRVSRQRYLVRP
ncbi:hypothetical protein, partial [Brasilonema octagenarum]